MRALDRIAVAVLEGIPERLWGFPPRLMPVIVERLGAVGALSWFGSNMPRYELTLRRLGGLRTHLLSTAISLINGCRYCTFGHAYAFELIYLRDQGRLFPLDEHEITALQECRPSEIRDSLAAALVQAGLPGEVAWLDRLIALHAGTRQPHGRDDARIAHLVRMFGVLNECGIAGAVIPDQAHDPSNKDSALKHRYTTLRADAAT